MTLYETKTQFWGVSFCLGIELHAGVLDIPLVRQMETEDVRFVTCERVFTGSRVGRRRLRRNRSVRRACTTGIRYARQRNGKGRLRLGDGGASNAFPSVQRDHKRVCIHCGEFRHRILGREGRCTHILQSCIPRRPTTDCAAILQSSEGT